MSEVLENVVELETVELVDDLEVEVVDNGNGLLTKVGIGILASAATAGVIIGGKKLYRIIKDKFGRKNVAIVETESDEVVEDEVIEMPVKKKK